MAPRLLFNLAKNSERNIVIINFIDVFYVRGQEKNIFYITTYYLCRVIIKAVFAIVIDLFKHIGYNEMY